MPTNDHDTTPTPTGHVGSTDEFGVLAPVYAVEWCGCIYESGYAVESLHVSKRQALRKLIATANARWQEDRDMQLRYGANRPRFDPLAHQAWRVRSIPVEQALDPSELDQIRSYANALNERCIQDTAAIGRLRSWISDALLALQSIDSDGECHTSLATIRGLAQQGVAVLNGDDNQTPNSKITGRRSGASDVRPPPEK